MSRIPSAKELAAMFDISPEDLEEWFTCKWCGQSKPLGMESKGSSGRLLCKPCRNARRRELRLQNLEKVRAYNRLYKRAYRAGLTGKLEGPSGLEDSNE